MNFSDSAKDKKQPIADNLTVNLENRLYQLDQELDKVRRAMFRVETGLETPPDSVVRLAELRRRYETLGAEFVNTYREWNSQQE